MLVITVFSHQEVRESIYSEQEGDTMCRQEGVEPQEQDHCVGICVDASAILMTCQRKLVVAICVGCLVVAVSEALQRFRSSGYDKVAQPTQHRETRVSKSNNSYYKPWKYSIFLIHSFSILSDDRSKASSKTMPPHSAIYSFLLQMRVFSPYLKVIQ